MMETDKKTSLLPLIKSREEKRKERDLAEARKAGNAPVQLDEQNREINPHIPEFISSAPWYLATHHPTLSHQKFPDAHALKEHERLLQKGKLDGYKRGVKPVKS